MSVAKYKTHKGVFWKVDEWLTLPNGKLHRFRRFGIPSRELAMALLAKARAEVFEGRHFERQKEPTLTVDEAWTAYEPITKRDNDAWQTDNGRAAHLSRHLGDRRAARLTLRDVDHYRNKRLGETTKRGKAPRPATLDREVELLKRMLNYAVQCGELNANPIAAAKLLRKPNVRRSVISEADLTRLVDSASQMLRPLLLIAYDTGMRKQEILELRWPQVDLREGTIRLAPQDTKGEEHRVVYLTARTLDAIGALPRHIKSDFVFVNPRTGKQWKDIRKSFRTARKKAELEGVWFHDLRRSFVTNARRRGIPESVVMKMSGHKTRSVFDRYNVISEDDLREAVRRMEDGIVTQCTSQDTGQSLDQRPKKKKGRKLSACDP